MENIISAINLLGVVKDAMDQIPVAGIENQKKFIGCANALDTVSKTLAKYAAEAEAKAAEPEEDANG